MAERSAIEWTDATFNPWWGCVKVSPGCDHCYAERDAHRFMPELELWGGKLRREFSYNHWREPKRWAARAAKERLRMRVFCASMADILDKDAPPGARERLWDLIVYTPELDWLLLTKRIGNAKTMLPAEWLKDGCPRNVWLGISVVNQEEADRDIPKLLELPSRIRWLSIEPMLGPVTLTRLRPPGSTWMDCLEGREHFGLGVAASGPRVDWVVVGGESGPGARPMHPDWVRSVRDQCAAARVPFFFKQWGEWAPDPDLPSELQEHYEIVGQWDGTSRRVGKKAAGRSLDGRIHHEFPRETA